jgi:hypothetical protein
MSKNHFDFRLCSGLQNQDILGRELLSYCTEGFMPMDVYCVYSLNLTQLL